MQKAEFDTLSPNLSSVVGSAVAVKHMVAASGITELSRMPSNDTLLLGAKNKYPADFSIVEFCLGYIEQVEIFQDTPFALRIPAFPFLLANLALAM